MKNTACGICKAKPKLVRLPAVADVRRACFEGVHVVSGTRIYERQDELVLVKSPEHHVSDIYRVDFLLENICHDFSIRVSICQKAKICCEERSSWAQDSPRFLDKGAVIWISVRSLNIEDDIEGLVLEGQVHGIAMNKLHRTTAITSIG